MSAILTLKIKLWAIGPSGEPPFKYNCSFVGLLLFFLGRLFDRHIVKFL